MIWSPFDALNPIVLSMATEQPMIDIFVPELCIATKGLGCSSIGGPGGGPIVSDTVDTPGYNRER